MGFPKDIKYTQEHEWLKVEGDTAIIGITEFAQSQLGDIVYVDYGVEVGDEIKADDEFGSIEAVKTVAELFMPVTGTVSEMNDKLDDNPELVNDEPYEAGWLIKITGFSMEEANGLMSAEEYEALVNEQS